jgi:hypothetical protein
MTPLPDAIWVVYGHRKPRSNRRAFTLESID